MHLTHSRSCIYFFLSIYTYALKNTVYGEIWRTIYQFWRFLSSYIKLPKRQLFLHFMILSKYLHIIYDGKYWWSNMFAAKGMKEKHRYFWKQIFIETFVFFLISWYFGLKYVKSIITFCWKHACLIWERFNSHRQSVL